MTTEEIKDFMKKISVNFIYTAIGFAGVVLVVILFMFSIAFVHFLLPEEPENTLVFIVLILWAISWFVGKTIVEN